MRVVVAVAAVMLLRGVAYAQETSEAPVCKADRQGETLLTKIEYPTGYTVEAPWTVTASVTGKTTGAVSTVTAVLDRIVESWRVSGTRELTKLPGPLEMTFRGNSMNEILNEAAHVWCASVIRARALQAAPRTPANAAQFKIT
jgi:hypothetical protein